MGSQQRIVLAAFRMCFRGTLGGDWAVGHEVTWKLLEQSGREMGAAEEASPFLGPLCDSRHSAVGFSSDHSAAPASVTPLPPPLGSLDSSLR